MYDDVLMGVRCISNTDTETTVELETLNGRYIKLTLPYEVHRNKTHEYVTYSKNIKQYCIKHNINYRDYIGIKHKDCN